MDNSLLISSYNPLEYICSYGALSLFTPYALALGKNAWILGSAQGFRRAGVRIAQILEENGIGYGFEIFSGCPTEKKAEGYAEEIRAMKADFVIALGGGKALDQGKRAAGLAGVPVVTVPTVSATNAAYRRNSMLYDEKGHFEAAIYNAKSPALVLADAEILQHQPANYLNAGIIAALASCYEARALKEYCEGELCYRFALQAAEVIYDYFKENCTEIKEAFASGGPDQVVLDTLTNIFVLTGLASNFVPGGYLTGFADAFYREVTCVRKEQVKLYGEIAGFGILVQLLLMDIPDGKWQEAFKLLSGYGFDYTLRDLGLDADMARKLAAALWQRDIPRTAYLAHVESEAEVLAAIAEADKRVHAARGNIFIKGYDI